MDNSRKPIKVHHSSRDTHLSSSSTLASKVINPSNKDMVLHKVDQVLSTLTILKGRVNSMCNTDLHSQDPHRHNSKDLMDMIR
ncbi:hypothetical protein AB205_0151600 [Aquarana catesbeiana]|uniref:Uncharacterized protein n=1 Tax=Aquarana catesbeiana TaxID=8400 RepID=A0A2G9SKW6_AQUCT|nr:hypothetical protein AB205_0151600 [Aquarana catesbeiana]